MSRRSGGLQVVLGAMAAGVPGQGGATWAVLQYALGLRRLGHRVLVVESVAPEVLVAPNAGPEGSTVAYAREAMGAAGLSGDWALLGEGTTTTAGRSYGEVIGFADGADVVVNLAGALRDPEVLGRVPVRAYVDLDPGFTQVWQESYGVDLGLDGHTHFLTYGLGIADGSSPVPTCGRRWAATVPPVVLGQWPPAPAGSGSWSTVANWRSYGTVEHDGLRYGQKAHSWRGLLPLPGLVDEPFAVALAIHPGDDADRRDLESAGWTLLDPARVASTPARYRDFVRRSKAELCVAKSGYVDAATGWFSDRSACYLAAGRPVVAQDTGFSSSIPTGAGLLPFGDLGEAAEAVARVGRDYETHRRAAMEVARDMFDADRVLPELLRTVGVAP